MRGMDAVAWMLFAITIATSLAAVVFAPRFRRRNLRRQLDGGGGSFSGVGTGFDAIWRPSADEAHAQWEAQVEMPAPAPLPGDGGASDDGRISIRVNE